jgi:uncharacterized cupredoxin-like copper-binding protein
MTRQRYLAALWLALGLVPLLAACAGAPAAAEASRRIVVTGHEMTFTPTQITARVGEAITIVFINAGVVEHDWAVVNLPLQDAQTPAAGSDATYQSATSEGTTLSLRIVAPPGKQDQVTFTPARAGRYTVVCTLPGHKEAGMMGMVTVVK